MKKIHFFGAGSNFIFYFGVMTYLSSHYILDDVIYSGSSSGAFVALVSSLNMNYKDVIKKILKVQKIIIKNHGSLLFVWTDYVIDFFNDIIPEKDLYDRLEIIESKISYKFKVIEKIVSSNFKSKKDLINSLLSSQQIPYILNKKIFFVKNDEYFIDGAFSDFLYTNYNNYIKIPQYTDIFTATELKSIEEYNYLFKLGYYQTSKLKKYYDKIFVRKL